MDRHAMLSEVGYLFSVLWKERGEEERGEEQRLVETDRQTDRESEWEGEEPRQQLPLWEKDRKEGLKLEAERRSICLCGGQGREWTGLAS